MTKEQRNFIVDFLVGGASGALARTLTAPLAQPRYFLPHSHVQIVHSLRRIYKEQGLLYLWRGNLTNVVRYFPTQAFNFAFKDKIKTLFPKYDPATQYKMIILTNVASGGLAGAGSLCIVYPLDYARTRLASDVGSGQRAFSGLFDCLMKTARGPSGILGLYNGFGVSVLGIIPYRGVYFGMYDSLAAKNPYKHDSSPLALLSKFAIAQTTAITAGYTSYPFDTVRRRLCMYKSALDCLRKMLKEEGLFSLYKGASANLPYTVGSALVLVFYGEIQDLLA